MKLSECSNDQVIKMKGQLVYVRFLKYVIEYDLGYKPDWDKVEVSEEGWKVNE